jgi:DNA-binding transcriptional LysR family regulator
MLNLLHARTFLAVIEAGGVRAAARRLALAPSTVLDHVRRLERELATPLIERRSRGTTPTSYGARILPLASALIATAERIRRLAHESSLRVAASSNVGIYMLQPTLSAFQRATGVDVETWIGTNHDVLDRLECGEADLVAMEWWDDRRGFAAHTWTREPLVVIVGRHHRWAGLDSVAVEELIAEPLWGGEPGTGTGRLLRRRLGPLADRLQAIKGCGSTEAVKRAVRAGRGASIVMWAAIADEVALGQLVALTIEGVELFKEIKLVVPDGLPSIAPAKMFLAHCGDGAPAHTLTAPAARP